MSGLLVSVRSAAEAHEALAGGVDLLDIKEPRHGPLGRASFEVWEQVRQAAAGRAPLSAALGELLTDAVVGAARRAAGFRFAKIGLAGCEGASRWGDLWAAAVDHLAPQVAPAAVVYADWQDARAPDPHDILALAPQIGCGAILVDTYFKNGGGVFDHLEAELLRDLFAHARRCNMLCVLAGSLRLDSIDQALALDPDYIAVRGAACGGDRTGTVKRQFVAEIAARIAGARRTSA